MEIRQMKLKDLVKVRDLEISCIKEYFSVILENRWEDLPADWRENLGASSRKSFMAYIESGLSFVAAEDDVEKRFPVCVPAAEEFARRLQLARLLRAYGVQILHGERYVLPPGRQLVEDALLDGIGPLVPLMERVQHEDIFLLLPGVSPRNASKNEEQRHNARDQRC